MGCATRSAEDFAAVLLMGSSLVEQLYRHKAAERFTEATRTQMELSEQVGRQIRDQGGHIDDVDVAIGMCLGRNSDWVRLSREQLAGLKYPDTGDADSIAVARREAFNLLRGGDAIAGAMKLKVIADLQIDQIMKGYLLDSVAIQEEPALLHVTECSAIDQRPTFNSICSRPVIACGRQNRRPSTPAQNKGGLRWH